MKIDTNAFLDSLPIMGVGLLGIFIVTIILIVGIYILKAVTSRTADAAETTSEEAKADSAEKTADKGAKKESAMDLLKEKEKTDFFEEAEINYISHDL